MCEKTLKEILENRPERYSWHMPGHKGKRIWDFRWEEDVTELVDTDNLQEPETCIKESEEKIASIHGAKASFLSVNGSSGMIMAMLDAVCKPGDTILAVRCAHKSFYNACIHTDLRPVYLMPELLKSWNFPGGVSLAAVEEAVCQYPEAKALFVTNPTYEGYWQDLTEIADFLHRKGKLLLVDEAHGAHVSYIGGYPKTALEMGADLVVQSYHKTLPSPTQTAVLHLGSENISRGRIRESINSYQTTSPSYWLMKGIDGCRSYMEAITAEQIKQYWESVKMFREMLASLPGVVVFPSVDISKILFRVRDGENWVSSRWLCEELTRMGEEPEGIFGDAVMLISTIMDTENDFERCFQKIKGIIKRVIPEKRIKNCEICKKRLEISENYDIINQPDTVISLREAYYAEKRTIELVDACGQIAASFVTPYPPGIPILCPGERITQESIDRLQRSIADRTEILGLIEDRYITVIHKKEEKR